MEEQRPEPDRDVSGMPSVNGHYSLAGSTRDTPGESDGLSEESTDVGGISRGGSEPPDGISGSAGEPGQLPDNHGDSLGETDWETTRYLAAATQLELKYARSVVSQIIGEPFCAVAPAAGADVVAVTRWALAALRRRAQRVVVLTCLLLAGVAVAVGVWLSRHLTQLTSRSDGWSGVPRRAGTGW